MWKKKDDAVAAHPEFVTPSMPEAKLEKLGESLDEAYRDRYSEKEKPVAAIPQRSYAEAHEHVLGSMGAYTDAVNDFTKSATAFIEQVPLLTKALDAYEHATKLSSELRKVLDMGDENLRALMSPLEQVINLRAVRGPEKKKPEPVRVDALRPENGRASQNYGQAT
jgi:hypothetical protein